MLTVVTGWSPSGHAEYGARFAETFDRYWPKDVQLIVYGEERVDLPRGEFRLLSEIPGCVEFLERHKDSRAANGREPSPSWKDSERAAGYSFKFDARKFSRQGYVPLAAAQGLSGLLCWLDGDVVTHAPVPAGFIERLLPDGKDVAYLGRTGKHSEIGFQLYRLPQALPMLQRFRDYYDSDRVFRLKETHSAYVWDRAREESGVAAHNLTPNGAGHVWPTSPLQAYTAHLKGKRKARWATR